MDEFALIRRYFLSAPIARGVGVSLGIGDDCALIAIPRGSELAVTTDTLTVGRHFPRTVRASDIGWKALAVNLSDLAAMGARPRWFTLALSLPSADGRWLRRFLSGLKCLATEHAVALVGGDTTRARELSITITAMGLLSPGKAMRRDTARQGDLICVTGPIGDAALALWRQKRRLPEQGTEARALRKKLDRPQPRVKAGRVLARFGAAGIDISDGFAADLGHVLEASGVGGKIDASALPASPAFQALSPNSRTALRLQLHGGDDYELCVCLRPADFTNAVRALRRIGVSLHAVGQVKRKRGLVLQTDRRSEPLIALGFNHFAAGQG